MAELPLTEQAAVELARSAALADRPGIVLLSEDLDRVQARFGSRTRAYDLLKRLEGEGRIRPVRRGVYVLVSATGTVQAGLLDLIDAVTPYPYVVTTGRALQFHELSDQHFRLVVVAVRRQLRDWAWSGDSVHYVRAERSPLRTSAYRTRRTRARIASPERALLDSVVHPDWGVTVAQVAEALSIALERWPDFADALARETARERNHAAARRLGFMVERLAGPEAARSFLPLRGDTHASTPLVIGASAKGPIDPRWRVRENVELEELNRTVA